MLCLTCGKRIGYVADEEPLAHAWAYLRAKHKGISPGCPKLRVAIVLPEVAKAPAPAV